MTPKFLGLALTFLMIAACGTVDETLPDATSDAGSDTSSDVSTDATTDASTDASTDTTADVTTDATVDVGLCGPDPSETCQDTGCAVGYTCVPADTDGCVPSGCSCSDGTWDCTADCGQAYVCAAEPDPSECDTPDPSATCLDSGCDDGYECVVSDDTACRPSACFCDGGVWGCTEDCNPSYACVPEGDPDLCPTTEPIGESCGAEGLSCSWGVECCCGSCSPATVCDCSDGQWACYATDACFIESCEGRTCASDTDCEGGGVETTCIDGMCALPADAEWAAGPELPLTIGACGDAGDSYELLDLDVDGDMLNLSVAYSGGCATHEFRLCWSGDFSDAAVVPVEATLELRHKSNGDACLAYPTEALQVPITDIADAYREQFATDAGAVRLNLDSMNAVYEFL